MTGPSGNRLSICPLRFRIASPRVPRALGEAILNLSGQIDLPITLETSHYLFIDLQRIATGPRYTFIRDDIGSSYIDHCLISSSLVASVGSCQVIPEHYLNNSDHLPISVGLSFGNEYEQPEFCKPREKIVWKNVIGTSLTENYSENVTSNLLLVIKKMGLRNICEETCLPSGELDN